MKPPVPERIATLAPYQPGRPIEEVERELGLSGTIKLASNENALGASPAALKAATAALERVHRYPEGGAVLLRRALAVRLGVAEDQLVFGNGSNEIIELAVRVFADGGRDVVFSENAFMIYELVARAEGSRPVAVPSRNFEHDLEALAAAVGPSTGVVFLANPNNPTGTVFARDAWDKFLAAIPGNVVIAVDEAYREFVDLPDFPDAVADLGRHPGLLALRTFSKAYGLAGFRIGYGVGEASLVDAMERLRQPFNVNLPAQEAALAALDDDEYLRRSRELVDEGRRFYSALFDRLGLSFVPSHANFVLVAVGDGDAVTEALLKRGVIVRPMGGYGYPDMIRVTVGTDTENARFAEVLEDLLGVQEADG